MALRSIVEHLLQPKLLAALITTATLLVVAGLWTPEPLSTISISVGILLGGTWLSLFTIRNNRISRSVESILDASRRSGQATHLPIIRRKSDDSEKQLGTIKDIIRTIAKQTSATQNSDTSTPVATANPKREVAHPIATAHTGGMNDQLLAEVLSTVPPQHDIGLSALAMVTLRNRLQHRETTAPSYIGPDYICTTLELFSGDIFTAKWENLNNTSRIELALVDLLIVDAATFSMPPQDPRTFQGQLAPEAEIWLIGSLDQRETLARKLREVDNGIHFVSLPAGVSRLTVLKKVNS